MIEISKRLPRNGQASFSTGNPRPSSLGCEAQKEPFFWLNLKGNPLAKNNRKSATLDVWASSSPDIFCKVSMLPSLQSVVPQVCASLVNLKIRPDSQQGQTPGRMGFKLGPPLKRFVCAETSVSASRLPVRHVCKAQRCGAAKAEVPDLRWSAMAKTINAATQWL